MHSHLYYRFRAWRREILFASYFVLAATVASLCVVLPAHAVSPSNQLSEMTVSPTSQRFELKPGEHETRSFNVLNSAGDSPIDVTISVEPYQVKNAQYEPEFTKQTERTQISRWVTFDKTRYRIEPGQRAEISYTVNVPQDIPAGGQYAVIFAETDAAPQQVSGVSAKKRAGMLLYARAAGNTREDSEATLKLPGLFQSNDVDVKTLVRNTGNVDFEAKLSYDIKDLFGKTVYSQEKPAMVIPDSEREIVDSWTKRPLFGIFQLHARIVHTGDTTAASTWIIYLSPIMWVILAIITILLVIWVVLGIRRKLA